VKLLPICTPADSDWGQDRSMRVVDISPSVQEKAVAAIVDARRGWSMIPAMMKPLVQPSTARKRGNPNWGKPLHLTPAIATEFELQVRQLGLTKEMYTASAQLRTWCERNKNRCYIPEWLLAEWGITVDPNIAMERSTRVA